MFPGAHGSIIWTWPNFVKKNNVEKRGNYLLKSGRRGRFFFGWWSVLLIGIRPGLGHGFNPYGISVIINPIAAELNLDRAATSWAPGIGRLEDGITSPLVGWLPDRFGQRGKVIAGVGLVLMYLITEVWHRWDFCRRSFTAGFTIRQAVTTTLLS